MEALRRRKREAADKQAAELQAAAKQAHKTKSVARQMKEAEFKTTRTKSYDVAPGTPATTAASTGIPEEDGDGPLPEDYDQDGDYAYESDSYDEESYEDDFEDDDFVSEDEEAEEEEGIGEEVDGIGALHMEQEDVRRVMSNYEQGLARVTSGNVSPQRSSSSQDDRPLKPAAVTGPQQFDGGMDIRSRASRLKEELTRKMGEECFRKAFDFIYDMRSRNKNFNRRDMETVVGKEYYAYCFQIDQLVYADLNYA